MNRRDAVAGGLALLGAVRLGAQASPPSLAANLPTGSFGRDVASTLMPALVFFAGKLAQVQMRNTGGAYLPAQQTASGRVFVAGLVDSSGYSSGIQERYQAYLLSDAVMEFGEHSLQPGAYGCGVVNGQLAAMDLGANTLWATPATRDTALARPTPLQVLPGKFEGQFRLYLGRNYAAFRKKPNFIAIDGAPQ